MQNQRNDLYNETYNQINGRAEEESTTESADGNAEESDIREEIAPTYKNGDTVTYQGKQYIVSAFGTDGDGNAIYDLEENGKTVFEDVPVSELSQSDKTAGATSLQSQLDKQALDAEIAAQSHNNNLHVS